MDIRVSSRVKPGELAFPEVRQIGGPGPSRVQALILSATSQLAAIVSYPLE